MMFLVYAFLIFVVLLLAILLVKHYRIRRLTNPRRDHLRRR